MRRRSLWTWVLAVLATALVAGAPAHADPGAAPAPREYRVLQKVHTDAVSTFLDGETFALGSKADVLEGTGTRLNPDRVWFHVDDASRVLMPAGLEFVAPAGTPVWLAPQNNPSGAQLWPGFSTESVPVGAIEDDRTTLRLADVEGPGAVEVFTTDAFGAPTRLWSSDEEQHRAFEVTRTHMHANWAFTQPGTYRLTVEASARRAAAPVSATATYTFVVGPLPEAVTTTTTLRASETELALGDSVELAATVTPASAAGFVEFKSGTSVLGHARLSDGRATLTTDELVIGAHDVTAEFVPEVLNLAGRSTSAAVAITVTEEPGGEPFGIAGVAGAYQPGDTLDARVAGVTLGEGQRIQWLIRPGASPLSGTTAIGINGGADGHLQQRLDASYDGYELSARLLSGTTVVQQTAWVALHVANTVEPLAGRLLTTGPLFLGDDIRVEVTGRVLADGESMRLARRLYLGGLWAHATAVKPLDARTYKLEPTSASVADLYAVQVVRDDLVVAQSEPFLVDVKRREALVEGIQTVYRAGQTLRASASVYPDLPGAIYRWQLIDWETGTWTTLKESTDPSAKTVELPLTLAHDEQQVRFSAVWSYGETSATVAQYDEVLTVADVDPSTQLFMFNRLSDHYHQGNTVNLQLIADPPLAADDRVDWEWKWPGVDWAPLPDAAGLTHALVAEQALNDVQVRATLRFAGGGEPVVAAPVTIEVDDHGAAARQQPTIAGETSVRAGETVTLTRELPENGPTVLSEHRWERKAAGADDWSALAGETGATLSFVAAPADDGAEYRVSLVKPDGSLAYGPSPAVALAVASPGVTVEQTVGGTVPATLALTLGAPASFGTFTPGVAREYTASTTATVTSSAGEAELTVGDGGERPGHLVNGAFALAEPLAGLGTVKAYDGPVAGDTTTVSFTQAIAADEPLRTGAYTKTLTFTLSTTTP